MSEESHGQMSIEGNVTNEECLGIPGKGEIYQIRVKGHINHQWSEWFGGFAITHQDDGTTVLTGPIADQPALHGLLVKIRNLALPLVSINRVGPDRARDRAMERR